MFIQKLRLQDYRCFSDKTFSFTSPFVLIEGDNGSGKTTILEALHYGCFLTSFRTNRINDLVSFDQKHFFVQVNFETDSGESNQIQIGLSVENVTKKRVVKVNKKAIHSYRNLISRYRIISFAEDDLQMVHGSPEVRRTFIDKLIVFFKPDFILNLKKHKQILDQRNKMLVHFGFAQQKSSTRRVCTKQADDQLKIWTKQLWEQAIEIQKERIIFLAKLEKTVNVLLEKHFSFMELSISFNYFAKNLYSDANSKDPFEYFWKKYREKHSSLEHRMQRSLFGAHLDDFSIIFMGKKARNFASRGQQKLIVFLMKIAMAQNLNDIGIKACLLLDDFLTDFDYKKLSLSLSLLSKLSCQVFITSPLKSLILDRYEGDKDKIQIIQL